MKTELKSVSEGELMERLTGWGIAHRVYEHEAVFTTKEADSLKERIAGAHSKNLFLKGKNGKFILVSVVEHKRVDLKELGRSLGNHPLSFGKAEELMAVLQIEPGHVGPLSLIQETAREVEYILDEDFLRAEWVNFHPLRNDRTCQMKPEGFLEFLRRIGHKATIMRIPEKA